MDIKNYIESGILEEYVLGKLSPEASVEVEQNAHLYPAVKQELDSIELALEQYAFLHAKEPPAGVLDQILKKVEAVPADASSFWNRLKPRSWARFLAVGMTVKFLLAATGLILLYLQNQKLHERLENRQDQIAQLQTTCDSTQMILQQELQFLKNINTRPIAMMGTSVSPQSSAAVHFNSVERKAFLTNFNLPMPPTGKQYQLWAIVDGKPVSMGVFDLPQAKDTLLEVPFIEKASAFAISQEEQGGKPQPSVNQIYVMGAIDG